MSSRQVAHNKSATTVARNRFCRMDGRPRASGFSSLPLSRYGIGSLQLLYVPYEWPESPSDFDNNSECCSYCRLLFQIVSASLSECYVNNNLGILSKARWLSVTACTFIFYPNKSLKLQDWPEFVNPSLGLVGFVRSCSDRVAAWLKEN